MTARGLMQSGENVGELIERALVRYADRIAFDSDDGPVRYVALSQMIATAIRRLEELGVPRGAAVVQIAENGVRQFALMAACYLGGFASVTLQPIAEPAVQAAVLAPAKVAIIVADPTFRDRAQQLHRCLGGAPHLLSHRGTDGFWPTELVDGRAANRAASSDIVRIGLTSGTSEGRPKGVLLSSRALAAVALANLADGDWPETPRLLCSEAMAGGFGNMIVPTLMRGGTFIALRDAGPGVWLAAVAQHRPNAAFVMPWSLRRLLTEAESETADLSSLTLLGYSGASLTLAEMRRALDLFGPILSNIYGQTEVPKALAILGKTDHAAADPARLRSLGLPYSGTSIALLDVRGQPVGPAEVGELCVRSAACCDGYLGDYERTERSFRDGWFRTGDLCRLDGDGYLHLVDRVTAAIALPSGTVLPQQVEAALLAAGVADAACIAAGSGMGIMVVGPIDPRDAAAALRVSLGHCLTSVPVEWRQVTDLPYTMIGRLDRRALPAWWQDAVQNQLEVPDVTGL